MFNSLRGNIIIVGAIRALMFDETPIQPLCSTRNLNQKREFEPAREERKPKDWEQRTNTKRFRKGK